MRRKTLFITGTGMILALTLVVQLFGGTVLAALGPSKMFVTGSLINACLLIATGTIGLLSGTIISFVTPVVAGFTNHTAAAAFVLPFSPVIGLSNFVLVLFYWLFTRKDKDKISLSYTGIGTGAIVKFLILYTGVNVGLKLLDLPEPLQKSLLYMFSWPQLITALIGGTVAVIVVRMLKLSLNK